jgi:hypothetical protein
MRRRSRAFGKVFLQECGPGESFFDRINGMDWILKKEPEGWSSLFD